MEENAIVTEMFIASIDCYFGTESSRMKKRKTTWIWLWLWKTGDNWMSNLTRVLEVEIHLHLLAFNAFTTSGCISIG